MNICKEREFNSGTITRLVIAMTYFDSFKAIICSDTHTTVSGRRCQFWDKNLPHRPNDQMRTRLDFTGHNLCAVADPTDPRPFCYTTDPNKRWDYCDCQPYSRTESGSECLRWDTYHHHIKYSLGSRSYFLLA